jgi:galactose mutarotase-like enzyme
MNRYGARFHGCRINEYSWRNQQLIVMENQLLRVGILASKGADLIELRYKPTDLDLLWHAPQTLLPGEYTPSITRSQGAFLDYYLGCWQEIFPIAGPAAVLAGAHQGQHGEVSLLPWDLHVRCDTEARIEVEFAVETVRTPFRLTRRMSLEQNSTLLRFEEKITNLGRQALPYAWGHHPTYGPPFLQAGCIIDLPPLDGAATESLVPGPEAGTEAVISCSRLEGGWCALRNPTLNLTAGLCWDPNVFNYFWMWQVYGGSMNYPYYGRTYNLAFEPLNCPYQAFEQSLAQNILPSLGPGESVETFMEHGIYSGSAPVRSIQSGGRIHG